MPMAYDRLLVFFVNRHFLAWNRPRIRRATLTIFNHAAISFLQTVFGYGTSIFADHSGTLISLFVPINDPN